MFFLWEVWSPRFINHTKNKTNRQYKLKYLNPYMNTFVIVGRHLSWIALEGLWKGGHMSVCVIWPPHMQNGVAYCLIYCDCLCSFHQSLCECLFSRVSYLWGSIWVRFKSPQLTAITLERKRVMRGWISGVEFQVSMVIRNRRKFCPEFPVIYFGELCGMICAGSGMPWARLGTPRASSENQVPLALAAKCP